MGSEPGHLLGPPHVAPGEAPGEASVVVDLEAGAEHRVEVEQPSDGDEVELG
jgi:hypothetical protein